MRNLHQSSTHTHLLLLLLLLLLDELDDDEDDDDEELELEEEEDDEEDDEELLDDEELPEAQCKTRTHKQTATQMHKDTARDQTLLLADRVCSRHTRMIKKYYRCDITSSTLKSETFEKFEPAKHVHTPAAAAAAAAA